MPRDGAHLREQPHRKAQGRPGSRRYPGPQSLCPLAQWLQATRFLHANQPRSQHTDSALAVLPSLERAPVPPMASAMRRRTVYAHFLTSAFSQGPTRWLRLHAVGHRHSRARRGQAWKWLDARRVAPACRWLPARVGGGEYAPPCSSALRGRGREGARTASWNWPPRVEAFEAVIGGDGLLVLGERHIDFSEPVQRTGLKGQY